MISGIAREAGAGGLATASPNGEDDAEAHLKRTIIGRQVMLPITDDKLDLSPSEQVFYAEFDGQRKTRVVVEVDRCVANDLAWPTEGTGRGAVLVRHVVCRALRACGVDGAARGRCVRQHRALRLGRATGTRDSRSMVVTIYEHVSGSLPA